MQRIVFSSAAIALSLALFIGCQSAEMTSAKVYMQQEEYDRALVHLRNEIEKSPNNAEAYFFAGQIYGEMDSLEQMVAMFGEAEKLDSAYRKDVEKWRESKSAEVFNKGIKLWKKKKDMEGALKWTLIATKIKPDNVNAWKNLAYLYQEKAVSMAENELPDSVKYYENKRFDTYKKAFELAPDDKELVHILARIHSEKGNPDKAIELLNPHLEETDDAKIIFAAVDAYDRKREKAEEQENDDEVKHYTEKTLELLTKAESLDPENAQLLFNIGVRYYNIKKFEEAGTYFDKVLAKESDNIDALYNKCLSLFYAEKLDEAESATIKLVEMDAKNLGAWDQLAIVWATVEKGKKAQLAAKIGEALKENDIEKAKELAEKLKINVNFE